MRLILILSKKGPLGNHFQRGGAGGREGDLVDPVRMLSQSRARGSSRSTQGEGRPQTVNHAREDLNAFIDGKVNA